MKTPFTGYLMPEYQFSKVNQDLFEKDILERKLKDCSEEPKRTTLDAIEDGIMWGLVGVIVGVELNNWARK